MKGQLDVINLDTSRHGRKIISTIITLHYHVMKIVSTPGYVPLPGYNGNIYSYKLEVVQSALTILDKYQFGTAIITQLLTMLLS